MSIRKRKESVNCENSNDSAAESKIKNAPAGSTRNAVLVVSFIFITSLTALIWVYMSFPNLEEHEKKYVKLPMDIEDAKNLGKVLDRYKEKYHMEVAALVFVTYIFLQTFAIPGSISLSILSGFLFPFPYALLLVCFCSATGASLCYILSSILGRKLVEKYCPNKAAQWAKTVNKHRDNILNYMLFLRMTPFLPNWFINIVSPCIDVPLFPFWLGTFLGVGPPSFLAIQAGQTLHELSAEKSTWSWTSVTLLELFLLLSIFTYGNTPRIERFQEKTSKRLAGLTAASILSGIYTETDAWVSRVSKVRSILGVLPCICTPVTITSIFEE